MLTSRVTLQAEPWNVEDVTITGKGIEVVQYAECYSRDDTQVGSRVLDKDEIAWSMLFGSGSMKDICVREMSTANRQGQIPIKIYRDMLQV